MPESLFSDDEAIKSCGSVTFLDITLFVAAATSIAAIAYLLWHRR